VLESIANKGRKDVGKFLEWRKANKILTAFLPTYQKLQFYTSGLVSSGTKHVGLE